MQKFKIYIKRTGLALVTVGGWLWAGFQYFDSKPSAVVGYIEPVGESIKVILDNGAEDQNADPAIGFFRFEDVSRGLHAVRFEKDGYHSLSRNFTVATWGDSLLSRELELVPMTEPKPSAQNEVLPTYSTMSSPDGTDLEDFAAVLNDVPMAHFYAELKQSDSGWVYLGKDLGNSQYQGPFFPAEFDSALDAGTILHSSSPVLLRDTKPDAVGVFGLKHSGGYELGDIVGFVKPGAEVRVVEIADKIGDEVIWARVSLVPDVDSPERRQ